MEVANKGCIKNIQRITGNLNSTTSSTIHTISPVNTSKTFLIAQGYSYYYGGQYARTAMVSAQLTNSTEVRISYYGEKVYNHSYLNYNVQIIEFY